MSEAVDDAEALRRDGEAVLAWLAAYRERVGSLPVASRVAPGEVRSRLPPVPPEEGERLEAVLRDLDEIVVPGLTHWQHPGFFAYFPSNNSVPSILGELLAAGIGVQGMLWSTSPACTELETHVLDWLAGMLGLPETFLSTGPGGGVIQDTASTAVLCATVAARERATGGAANRQGARQPLVAYASAEAHSSVEKAIRLAGIGSDNLRRIPVDEAYALRPQDLATAMAEDSAAGRIPFLVVATVGTTSSLAVDPLPAIGPLARRHGAWLHVDAAMAGTAALCPEHRALHAGLELADSYTVNPHKWMLTNFDCSAFWVADRRALVDSLSILPEYLRNPASESGEVIDYRDWQVQLGRRFRALKLWLVIRRFGVEGLRAMVRRHLALAAELARWVESDSDWELAAPPRLALVCCRHRGGDEPTRDALERVNASGEAFCTHTRLGGRLAVRVAVGQATTERRHVARVWELLTGRPAPL